MDTRVIVKSVVPKLTSVANLIVAGKQAEAQSALAALIRGLPRGADRRTAGLLVGLVVASVSARQRPPVPTLRKFEDPLTAFEDPLTAFEDPLTAFEDPLTAFGSPAMARLAQSLLAGTR